MHDYRYRFPESAWGDAVLFMHLVTEGRITNMLGDPLSETAEPALASDAAVFARKGIAERNGIDPTGEPVTYPATGLPGWWYVHVRADIPPEALPADPAAWGFVATSPEESAAVLGVWA